MNDPEEVDAIKAYAREKGLKVYSIGFYHKWADRNINVFPLQLLGWIKNAAFVITDTFHGSVISIICNSKIVVKVRESNRNKLTSLLGEFDLSDRTIESFSEIDDVVQKEINFDHVNQLLAQKQKDSLKYLTNAIEGKDE
ncbi:polysaccharide pyruvyl transferase family protein [Limosilactobacillus fermentum]